ncbi:hypothetical protein Pmani_030972 [Petrolisthes manimaculis]|uniref:Uncharacterized protein n=1 Tax=Petrolisthes manimaculis TaxID=1843537 RepID=A0AAE1NWC2_9EUCA|nr:hypothetical protein Pmani_030972 [Petrolisthes manimaculis]
MRKRVRRRMRGRNEDWVKDRRAWVRDGRMLSASAFDRWKNFKENRTSFCKARQVRSGLVVEGGMEGEGKEENIKRGDKSYRSCKVNGTGYELGLEPTTNWTSNNIEHVNVLVTLVRILFRQWCVFSNILATSTDQSNYAWSNGYFKRLRKHDKRFSMGVQYRMSASTSRAGHVLSSIVAKGSSSLY